MGNWENLSGSGSGGGGGAAAPGDPSGLTATIIEYWVKELPLAAITMARIGLSGTKPSPLGTYLGVHVYAESPDGGSSRSQVGAGTADSAIAAPAFEPTDLGRYPDGADQYLAVFSLPVGIPAYYARIYAVGYSANGENTLVPASEPSPSPNCTLLVGVPDEIVGREYAESVTGLSATADLATIGGIVHTRVFVQFTPPDDTRWTGVYVHVIYEDDDGNEIDNIAVITNGTGASPSNWFPAPLLQTAKVRALSFSDPGGTSDPSDDGVNSYVSGLTPETTVSIGTNSGTVNAANNFNFDTSDFHVDPDTGAWAIKNVDFSKAINFNASTFDFDGLGDFVVKDGGIESKHLYTNGIDVGGGSNKPTLFRVYNHSGSLSGFIGDDFGSSGYDGAWFKRLLVGGSGPSTAPFFSDSSGNVIANGVYVYSAGTPLGWIGQNGSDVGAWFKQLSIGGTSFSAGKIKADASGNVTITDAPLTITLSGIKVAVDIANDATWGDYVGLTVRNNYLATLPHDTTTRVVIGIHGIGGYDSGNNLVAWLGQPSGFSAYGFGIDQSASLGSRATAQGGLEFGVYGATWSSFIGAARFLDTAGNQLLKERITGWGTPTGTLLRTALSNSSTATDVLQALMAVITDLKTHGLFGT